RYGTPGLVTALGAAITERVRVGGRVRALNLDDPTTHPAVAALTLAAARAKLVDALAHLPELAAPHGVPHALAAAARDDDGLELVLDELGETGFEQRPRLPFAGHATGPGDLARVAGTAPALDAVLGPLTLDALTVADDPGWLDAIEAQTNLP